MKILAINCGSSTLKFELFDGEAGAAESPRQLAHGLVDRIGGEGSITFKSEGKTLRESASVANHEEAIAPILAWLRSSGLLGVDNIGAIGHRIVHGGDRFVEPARIDDEVMRNLEAIRELAPLHNTPALSAIRALRSACGPEMPMVAVFDTAFHHAMPPCASHYAIPEELATKHRIRRYGFHGLAHRSMTERYAALVGAKVENVSLVTLQLGNGCSAAAISQGRSVDTSMGFTPLEGLVMGTRSGDLDPSLAGWLARREGVDVAEVENWLNRRSGLLGVSGRSSDMRELLALEQQGDARAELAVDMFCYRVRKYIGAYLAALGGANAVIFGGGIGENSPVVRARISANMEWCGLTLDPASNSATVGTAARISTKGATVGAYVIPVDESLLIVQDTLRCLEAHPNQSR
jgi:acetate kinase